MTINSTIRMACTALLAAVLTTGGMLRANRPVPEWSLDGSAQQASFVIHQGVEMGRPSLLHVDAARTSEGIVATLRGSCVSVMQGEISL